MNIFRGKDLKAKNWSGGKTTELFIYPENGSYEAKEFSFRLSKATIEINTSLFTKLSAVKRELMVLDGNLQLVHSGRYNKRLFAYESDRFSGDWQTSSNGLAEDFNLMMMNATEGYLQHISSKGNSNSAIKIETLCDVVAVYCAKGIACIASEILYSDDIAVFEKTNDHLNLELSSNTDLIIVRIWLNN